jgi:hypothetical protein
MRINIQKKILVGLMGIGLILMYSSCTQLSQEYAPTKSPGVQEMSSEEAKPTSSEDRVASVEKQSQPVEKSESRVEQRTRSIETATTMKKAQQAKSYTPCVHRVRWPGETLSVIAKWYTDDFANWKALAKANPKLNPNRMLIGTKIRIPEDLVKNREPMPQEFLGKFASKQKKK